MSKFFSEFIHILATFSERQQSNSKKIPEQVKKMKRWIFYKLFCNSEKIQHLKKKLYWIHFFFFPCRYII